MLKNKKWENEITRRIFIGNYSCTWVFAASASCGAKNMTFSAVLIGLELANARNIPVLYFAATG